MIKSNEEVIRVSETQQPGGQPSGQHDNSGWIILGVILVVAGFFLGAQSLGLVPWPLTEMWRFVGRARGGVGIVLLGIALIMWAQSGRRIEIKRSGGKLTRSRSEKWIAGVLGGLSQYFGVDVTLLRLAFIGLVVLLDVGGLILAYIVMAIVVPLEPEPTAPQVAPPAPQQPAAPPAQPTAQPAPQAPTPPAPPTSGEQDGATPPADA